MKEILLEEERAANKKGTRQHLPEKNVRKCYKNKYV